MDGSPKPTAESSNNINLPQGLVGLGSDTTGLDPIDLRAVVEVLTRVEDLIESIHQDAAAALLETIAGGLRAVVMDELPDLPAAMGAIGQGAEMIERFFTDTPSGEPSVLANADDVLQVALGGEPGAVAAELAAGDAEDMSLDDIAARLMGCTCENREELRDIITQLELLAAQDRTPDEAAQPIRVAAAFIEQAILGSTDDSDKSLASAADFVAEAIAMGEDVEKVASGLPSNGPAAAPAPSATAPAILPEDADMEILKDYIVESFDHIEASEVALLSLETNPDDLELVNTVFRAFHTIKGTSGFFGLSRNMELAHLAENLLDRARSGEIKLVGGYADLCLRSCDALRTMIQSVEQAEPGGVLAIPAELDELLVHLSDPAAAGIDEEEHAEPMRVGDILVGQGVVDRDDMEAIAKTQGGAPLGQSLVEQNAAPAQDVAKALRIQKQTGGASATDATVRVATDRLDTMINMVGELVIAQSMVAEDAADQDASHPRLNRNVTHAGKIIRDLQDLTMSLRMVPLKGVFHKMQRLVRDLGRKSNKQVRLVTEGDETEIDRNMVELLNDPLLHMIRNSVDHGIESVEDRAMADKPEVGIVRLRAYHSAGNVVIELQDDGQGLNRDKIVAKAVERGLIESGSEMSDSDVYALIWNAGFSTADKVTDVSGRGVGMDVVKRSIEELRGRVEVASEPGRGSTFTLRLPLTMAIADAMLVRVGGGRFLLPTITIEQSFRPTAKDISTVVGQGEMVMLRGDLLPVFRLHRLFNVREAVTEVTDGILIVIEGEGRRCAVLVDELLGQQQVVIKSLGEAFGNIPGVAGGAILGDGHVGLIIDAGGLIQLATEVRDDGAGPIKAAG